MPFHPIEWHDTLPSTNTHLKMRLAEDPALPSGCVVAARRQTAGRGRYARTWRASEARDLTFSLLLRAPVAVAWLPLLPMAAALAVSDYLRALDLEAVVKWPNDVLVTGQKICGILSEYLPEAGAPHAAIVGIGLNLGMTVEEAARIDRPATSVLIERGSAPAPEAALDGLLPHLDHWVARWRAAGFAGLREAWEARVVGLGQPAAVGEGANRRRGIIEGFDDQGALLLRRPDGRMATILMGDVVVGE